jgi:hypothetical protein
MHFSLSQELQVTGISGRYNTCVGSPSDAHSAVTNAVQCVQNMPMLCCQDLYVCRRHVWEPISASWRQWGRNGFQVAATCCVYLASHLAHFKDLGCFSGQHLNKAELVSQFFQRKASRLCYTRGSKDSTEL